jgi:hypothetical protein
LAVAAADEEAMVSPQIGEVEGAEEAVVVEAGAGAEEVPIGQPTTAESSRRPQRATTPWRHQTPDRSRVRRRCSNRQSPHEEEEDDDDDVDWTHRSSTVQSCCARGGWLELRY